MQTLSNIVSSFNYLFSASDNQHLFVNELPPYRLINCEPKSGIFNIYVEPEPGSFSPYFTNKNVSSKGSATTSMQRRAFILNNCGPCPHRSSCPIDKNCNHSFIGSCDAGMTPPEINEINHAECSGVYWAPSNPLRLRLHTSGGYQIGNAYAYQVPGTGEWRGSNPINSWNTGSGGGLCTGGSDNPPFHKVPALYWNKPSNFDYVNSPGYFVKAQEDFHALWRQATSDFDSYPKVDLALENIISTADDRIDAFLHSAGETNLAVQALLQSGLEGFERGGRHAFPLWRHTHCHGDASIDGFVTSVIPGLTRRWFIALEPSEDRNIIPTALVLGQIDSHPIA